MDVAQEAYQQALNSSGETMKQNAVYMEGLEAKTALLKAEFEKLVISKGGLQDFAKGLLDIGEKALKVVNALGGLPTILNTILPILIAINATKLTSWMSSVLGGITNIVYMMPNAISAWKAYAVGIVSANTAIEASVPVIGAVLIAISAITSAISKHNAKIEEQNKKIKDNILSFKEQNQIINDNLQKLNDENITREELNSIIDTVAEGYDAERLKLLDNNKARQETIDLLKKENKARQEELINTGFSVYEKSLNNLKSGYKEFDDILKQATDHYSQTAKESGLYDATTAEEQINALNEYKYALIEQRSQFDENSLAFKSYTTTIQNIESVLSNLNTQYSEDIQVVDEYRQALNSLGKTYDENTHQIITMSNEAQKRYERGQKYSQAQSKNIQQEAQDIEDLAKTYNITADDIIAYQEAHDDIGYEDAIVAIASEKQALEEEVKTLEELQEIWENSAQSVSTLVSSISKLSSALKEQEENGSLSLQTQLELIDAGYAGALAYNEETNACTLDEEAMIALTQAKIEEQIANLKIEQSNVIAQLQSEGLVALETANDYIQLAKAKSLASMANASSRANSVDRGYSASYSGYGNSRTGYNEEITQELKLIENYESQIQALESTLTDMGKSGSKAFNKIGSSAKKAGGSTKDATKTLDDLKSKYDKVISFITSRIDKVIRGIEKEKETAINSIKAQIDARERQKDSALDSIEAQIDALEDEKDAREKYWDDQIDALKKANDELKDQLELQEKLDALERARNTKVKVYKEGQGFVYDVDQTAVKEAQDALDEYLSEKAYEDELERLESLKDAEIENYDQRIDALNKYKDSVEKSYEEQIRNLEASRDALEDNYDAQIEYYNNYKDQFEEMVNAYEDQQTMLLASQLTGINFENNNWMTRLDNLANFVNQYNKLQAQIGSGSTDNAGGSGGTTVDVSSAQNSKVQNWVSDKGGSGSKSGNEGARVNEGIEAARKRANIKVVSHASGTSSIKDDELAIVGENPNKELIIGSKANNGTLMSLGKGSGVVNAQSTNTLAGLLNQLGSFGASNFGGGNGILNDSHNESFVVNGVTIQGANITDPQSFANGLLNMKAEALQRAYRHR